jgi:hypothetical protein
VLLPSDTHRKHYVHYSSFTSISDLFTDSLVGRRGELIILLSSNTE